MELIDPTVVRLELNADVVSALQSIADKEGLVKEQVAREAIELWVEHYRKYGPAFSRTERATPLRSARNSHEASPGAKDLPDASSMMRSRVV